MGGDSGSVTAVNSTTGATIWSHPVTGGAVHAVLLDQGALFVGGLFETYNGYTQHGLVKVSTADGSVITAFTPICEPTVVTPPSTASTTAKTPLPCRLPPTARPRFSSASEATLRPAFRRTRRSPFNINTGQRILRYGTTGDSQAVGTVGDTVVAGYHNSTSASVTSANYFGIQLEGSNFTPTTWDPAINGTQGNADGGNNGVQTIYVDSVNDIVFFGGGFLHWNGRHRPDSRILDRLLVYAVDGHGSRFTDRVTAAAGNGNAYVSFTAPVSNGGSPISGYTVKSSPGGFTATAPTATPVTVSGLTNGGRVHVQRHCDEHRWYLGAFHALHSGDPREWWRVIEHC